jgi:hypothetical protein
MLITGHMITGSCIQISHSITSRNRRTLCHQQHFLIFNHFGVVGFDFYFLFYLVIPNVMPVLTVIVAIYIGFFFCFLGFSLVLARMGLTTPTTSTLLGHIVHDLFGRVLVVPSSRITLA